MSPSYNHFFRSPLIRCETLNTIGVDGELNQLHLDTMGDWPLRQRVLISTRPRFRLRLTVILYNMKN